MNQIDLLDLIAKHADHITKAIAVTGKTIEFRDKEFRPTMGGVEDRGGAFLDMAANRATVWRASGQPLHHIFHVLLHLHRYWVEGVPQLWDQKTGCTGLLFDIESAYEHIAIVPVEISHFPEAYSYWISLAEARLHDSRDQSLLPDQHRAKLFQLYLLAQTAFPHSQITDIIAEEAEAHNLADEFSGLKDFILKNYEQKAFVLERLYSYRTGKVPERLGLRWLKKDTETKEQKFCWYSLQASQAMEPASKEPMFREPVSRGPGSKAQFLAVPPARSKIERATGTPKNAGQFTGAAPKLAKTEKPFR